MAAGPRPRPGLGRAPARKGSGGLHTHHGTDEARLRGVRAPGGRPPRARVRPQPAAALPGRSPCRPQAQPRGQGQRRTGPNGADGGPRRARGALPRREASRLRTGLRGPARPGRPDRAGGPPGPRRRAGPFPRGPPGRVPGHIPRPAGPVRRAVRGGALRHGGGGPAAVDLRVPWRVLRAAVQLRGELPAQRGLRGGPGTVRGHQFPHHRVAQQSLGAGRGQHRGPAPAHTPAVEPLGRHRGGPRTRPRPGRGAGQGPGQQVPHGHGGGSGGRRPHPRTACCAQGPAPRGDAHHGGAVPPSGPVRAPAPGARGAGHPLRGGGPGRAAGHPGGRRRRRHAVRAHGSGPLGRARPAADRRPLAARHPGPSGPRRLGRGARTRPRARGPGRDRRSHPRRRRSRRGHHGRERHG